MSGQSYQDIGLKGAGFSQNDRAVRRTKGSTMYCSIYMFPVSKKYVETFLQIQKAAAARYIELGSLDDETFAPVSLDARYGTLGFLNTVELLDDETLYISLSRFRDRNHHDEVMAQTDSDEQINLLFEKLMTVVDIGRIVRGEFERVV